MHSHDGGKPHSHALPERFSWKGLLALGASAGLIPCPSALVVLLGAIAQGQIALGMLLIVAFSAGLAMTLTVLGLAVVFAGKAISRMPVPGRLTLALPTVSAVLIVGVGIVLTVAGAAAGRLTSRTGMQERVIRSCILVRNRRTVAEREPRREGAIQ